MKISKPLKTLIIAASVNTLTVGISLCTYFVLGGAWRAWIPIPMAFIGMSFNVVRYRRAMRKLNEI